MKKEIQAIIDEHLPSMAAGELKKYIEKQEFIEEQLIDARAVIEDQEKALKDYEKQETRYKEIAAREAAADERERGLIERELETADRERQFELELLKAAKESMFENMKNMERLVDKVFGHPNVQITRSREERYTDQYGNRNSDYNSDDETRRESKT